MEKADCADVQFWAPSTPCSTQWAGEMYFCGFGAEDSRGVLEGVVERGDLYGRGAAVRLKSAISHLLDQASYLPPPSNA